MVANVAISTELLAQIVAHAQQSPFAEVCGLLFGTPDVIDALEPCTNVAAEPARRFEIDPAQLLAAHRRSRAGGPVVIGHYHSHPSGRAWPSATDAADAVADGSVWLIVAGSDVTAWRAVANGAVEGRFDPLALRMGASVARNADVEER
jgi:proteasome lid subunit RPN8/RPN11